MPGTAPRSATTRERPPNPAGSSLPVGWLGAGLVVALTLVVVLVLGNGSAVYTALGYGDPGAVTRIGTYLLRFLVDIAGAVCAGALVYAAFFTASTPASGLSAAGWAALRLGGWAAWGWFAAALAMVPFDMAETIGVSVLDVLSPQVFGGLFTAQYEPRAWLVAAALALVVALCCRVVVRWRPAVALAAVAATGLLPPAVVGYASAGPGHDLALGGLIVHVVAAALWLGVLAAFVVHLRRGTGRPDVAADRYRRFALGCWLALAASGLLTALVLVSPAQLFTTGYGRNVLLKVAALSLLGALGTVVRTRVLRTAGTGRAALRLACAEIAVMLVTVALSMGLAQTPPPALFGGDFVPVEVALGYPLPGAPTLWNLLTTWRLDVLLGVAVLAGAAVYLLGVRRLRRRGEPWPVGRIVAWLGGCVLVLFGTSSGVGAYAPAGIGAHMTSHMLLNMLAPLLLVLGGPVTLALRALRPAEPGAAPGPREWLTALTTSSLARVVSHPGPAVVLFVSSYYGLYFTGAFEWAMSEHWSRMALNVWLLAVGYQFYWIIVGVDPSPRRFPHLGRLGMVFAVMPFHAVFAVILISMRDVIAENYFRTLDLAWSPDLLADQRLAGVVSLVAGELALVAAQVVLLIQWHRHDQMAGFRSGRHDEDEETVAYRAMLATWKQSRGS